MEKLNSEELTKKVQEVKESKTHRLGGGKYKERALNFMANVCDKIWDSDSEGNISVAASTLIAFALSAFLSKDMNAAPAGLIGACIIVGVPCVIGMSQDYAYDMAKALRNKAKALSEKRATSEVKAEVSDNAPAEKAVEKASKPTASRPKADRVKETLIRNKQMVRC